MRRGDFVTAMSCIEHFCKMLVERVCWSLLSFGAPTKVATRMNRRREPLGGCPARFEWPCNDHSVKRHRIWGPLLWGALVVGCGDPAVVAEADAGEALRPRLSPWWLARSLPSALSSSYEPSPRNFCISRRSFFVGRPCRTAHFCSSYSSLSATTVASRRTMLSGCSS